MRILVDAYLICQLLSQPAEYANHKHEEKVNKKRVSQGIQIFPVLKLQI
jgi:hypothetical protein